MTDEKVSIIVPVYMGAQWLPRCIDSIVGQTNKNLEIILVDDGSPDNSGDICEKYATNDSRIKVVHKDNGGLSDARNAGINEANGNYIMFVDEDDYIHPQMVDIMLQTMLHTEADIVVCDFQAVPDNKEVDYQNIVPREQRICFEGQEIMNQLYYRNLLTVVAWNKMYKKSVFLQHRYIKGRVHDDESAIHYFLHDCQKIVYINQKLYYYVQREGSITSKRKWNYYSDAWQAYTERLIFLEKHGYEKMAYWTKEQMLNYAVKNYKEIRGDDNAKKALKEIKLFFNVILNSSEVQNNLSFDLKRKYRCFAINPILYSAYAWFEQLFVKSVDISKKIWRKIKKRK